MMMKLMTTVMTLRRRVTMVAVMWAEAASILTDLSRQCLEEDSSRDILHWHQGLLRSHYF